MHVPNQVHQLGEAQAEDSATISDEGYTEGQFVLSMRENHMWDKLLT